MLQWIVSSSVLILVMIGLRFLLRGRIKPAVQYALWALVLVRLLLPVQFGSTQISLQNSLEKAPVVQQMELADKVEDFVYHEGVEGGYFEYQPPAYIPPVNEVQPPENNGQVAPQQPVQPAPQVFTPQQVEEITRVRDVKDVLTWVWVGGMIAMGLVFVLANLRFGLQVKNGKKDGKEGKIPVIVTDKVETPCLFGLFRPRIYLPTAVAEEPRHRAYSVAHELTHYRHGDALWAVLRCLCIVVHWYNPLVWWAAVLSREDGEIACDEATIARLGQENRADYGRVLVDLTCRKRTDLLQTATTMTGSAKGLTQRIKMIVKQPKTAIYALIILILVGSLVVGCTFTGSKPDDTDTPDSTESTESTDSTENILDFDLDAVIVRHTEGATYDLPGKVVETDKMKDGYLYAIDSQTTRQLSQEKVDNWCDLSDRVLYVTQAEPYVVRCAWIQQVKDEIHLRLGKGVGEGVKIKAMQYVQGKLMMAVQGLYTLGDFTVVAACIPDAPTQGSNTIEAWRMAVYRIESFTYAASSTAFEDVKTHISTEDMGATIRWKGQRYGGEEGMREYYYFVDSGEFWYADTFEKVSDSAPTAAGTLIVPDANSIMIDPKLAECTPGHLYYWDEVNDKAHLVADEKIICNTMAYGKVFFVKAAEPTKLYVAKLNDLRNHQLVYESDFGPITKVFLNNFMVYFTNETLLLIENDKRLTVLDFTEDTATPIVEMHYMSKAGFYPGESKYKSWREVPVIRFEGKLSPEEQEREYYYHTQTGEMKDSA